MRPRKPKIIPWKKCKTDIRNKHTECEFFFDYTSRPPSLQNMAAVSIAVKLWTEPAIIEDVRQYSENFGFDYTTLGLEAYDGFEERVLQKLNETQLPNSLKCKVFGIIQPIGFQLLKCFSKEEYGQAFRRDEKRFTTCTLRTYKGRIMNRQKNLLRSCRFYDLYKIGGSVYWTMDGTIDNVTSLKEIIKSADQETDFYNLYELACKYCLEEFIPDLWKKVSRDKKNELDFIDKYEYNYHLMVYWTAFIENKMLNINNKLRQYDPCEIYKNNLSIQQNMISLSILSDNPYSLKYFWYQLNEQEKNDSIGNWVNQAINSYILRGDHEYNNCNDKTNILCFLLSHLIDEQDQKEVFKIHSEIILRALFFQWPWQKFFMSTISKTLDYISEKDFVEIMSFIADKNKKRNRTAELFREIWLKSPLKLKNYLIRSLEDSASILYRFLEEDDVETIFMIFEYATAEGKKRILFSMTERYDPLLYIIYSDKLNLIDTLVAKSLTLSCDIEHFKQCVILVHTNDLLKKWISENNFQAVDMFLSWGIKSPDELRTLKNLIDKNKIYSSLVCLGDYELIDRFMHWCFESEDEISVFKLKFIHALNGRDNSFVWLDLLWKLSYCKQGCDLFEKFVNYHFRSNKEESNFKQMCLKYVTSFLASYKYEFAEKIVNWCFLSVEEGNRYKNSLAISEEGKRFILRTVNRYHPVWDHPSELIKWFSITKESADELKSKLNKIEFISEYCDKTDADYIRCALFYLLDKHSVNSTKCNYASNSRSNGSNITTEIREALRVSHERKKFPKTLNPFIKFIS